MRFRWESLERARGYAEGDEGEEGLGVFTGQLDGTWGVSTLNPGGLSKEPYVRMFENQFDAIRYARDRVIKGPLLYYPKANPKDKAERNPRAKTYYVLEMPKRPDPKVHGERFMIPRYRVHRGQRGGEQYGDIRGGKPVGRLGEQSAVMVFQNMGEIAGHPSKIRWKLNKAMTINITDLEAERERVSDRSKKAIARKKK
jgi:hypothetical protein